MRGQGNPPVTDGRGKHNLLVDDERFNEIFNRNHGAAAIAYYAARPVKSCGSTWTAIDDFVSKAGRPSVGRVHSARGAQ